MSGLSLRIDSDDLEDLRAAAEVLADAVLGPDVRKGAGFSMEETIRQYLRDVAGDDAHHETSRALGADRTGFYEKAAEAVEAPQVEGDMISVSIPHEGLAQRYYGGEIEAKPGGFLTIPAIAETYGKRAGEFDNLRLIIFPGTELAALIDKDAPADEGSVYYWLVRSVQQEGDETVLPTDAEIIDPAIENVRDYITRVWDERKAA